MSKSTVIEIVQDILSDMSSDEVNSITDTLEALQVAQIVSSTYNEMIANKNWPHLRTLLQLNASGDSEKPTHMTLPTDVKELENINYNKVRKDETRSRIDGIIYLRPDDFLQRINNRNNTLTNIKTVSDDSGIQLLIKNDKQPEWWTSFDDEVIVFDSWDKEVEATLQTTKTQCLGYRTPTFSITDAHIPDLPLEAFPALIAEAKSTCFARIKQMPDAKSEQQSTRSKNWLSRKAWQAAGGIKFPDYGRKKRTQRNGRNQTARD